MTKYTDNGTETAMTVVADDNIKELLQSGNIEEIQKVVQKGVSPSAPAASSCFTWSKGQIIGKYEIIKKIGKGGMGVIYLARHTQLDVLRALKVLPSENAGDNNLFAERFIREARIASKIRHPNVVEVMDVETDPQFNISYIVMEYVDGGSLRQILKAQSKLTFEQSVITIQSVAAALCTAARHGIVHRDIKPDNIMFTKQGCVKLADLGIAKKEDEDDSLTKTNVMMGTPAYLSPEQVENPKAVDIRSDIYSLGATFYEMLTGQTPYTGKSSYDILRKIFSEPVPDPRALDPEIPGEIASVIMKMLAKEPQKRFQTPEQLLEALSKFIPSLTENDVQIIVKSIIDIKGEGSSEFNSCNSVFTGTFYRMRKAERRKKMLYLSFAGALLLTLSVAAAFLFSGSDKKSPASGNKSPVSSYSIPVPEKNTAPELYSLDIKTVPGSTLRIIRNDGQVFTYAGNIQGLFNISNLTPGEYGIEISCPDYVTSRKKHSVPSEGTLEIPLTPDFKKMELTGLWGTKVELQCPDGRERMFTIPVEGTILIGDLKKGSYLIKAFHKDHLPLEKSLVIENDMKFSLKMEKIYKSFSIVTLPGSKVELLQNFQVKFIQKTDQKGKNFFPQLKNGIYELRISAPGYKTHTSVLHIEKDTSLTVPLEKSLYSVTIYGTAGTKGMMYSGTRLLREFEIPNAGFITVNNVARGKYLFTFSKTGYTPQKHDLNVGSNTSLQITLTALENYTAPSVVKKNKESAGKLSIYLSASGELLNFLRPRGVEIKVGNENWIKVRSFPFTRELEAGVSNISVRGQGIASITEKVQIAPGKNSDILLAVRAKNSTVVFLSNRDDTLFTIGGRSCRAGEKISIEPFREYVVTARSREQSIEKKIISTLPEEKIKCPFVFTSNIRPMHGQYEQGMALFRQKRYKEALPLLLTAAKARHPEAVMQAAYIYEKGIGMWFSDKKESLRWYCEAARLKNVDAALKVADAIFEGDLEAPAAQMMEFYQMALKKNDPKIFYRVSELYKKGFKEISPDETLSLKYLIKAAELEFPEAMYDLGIRYEKGHGVPFNSQKALFWIKKAAGKGHYNAEKYWNKLNP